MEIKELDPLSSIFYMHNNDMTTDINQIDISETLADKEFNRLSYKIDTHSFTLSENFKISASLNTMPELEETFGFNPIDEINSVLNSEARVQMGRLFFKHLDKTSTKISNVYKPKSPLNYLYRLFNYKPMNTFTDSWFYTALMQNLSDLRANLFQFNSSVNLVMSNSTFYEYIISLDKFKSTENGVVSIDNRIQKMGYLNMYTQINVFVNADLSDNVIYLVNKPTLDHQHNNLIAYNDDIIHDEQNNKNVKLVNFKIHSFFPESNRILYVTKEKPSLWKYILTKTKETFKL